MKDPRLAALQRKHSAQESWLIPSFPLAGTDASRPSGPSDETGLRKGAREGINTQPQQGSAHASGEGCALLVS